MPCVPKVQVAKRPRLDDIVCVCGTHHELNPFGGYFAMVQRNGAERAVGRQLFGDLLGVRATPRTALLPQPHILQRAGGRETRTRWKIASYDDGTAAIQSKRMSPLSHAEVKKRKTRQGKVPNVVVPNAQDL